MKSHLKRLAAPRTWPIKRKQNTFIIRPQPSGSTLEMSLPIAVVLKDLLGYAQTTREAKRILLEKEVLVNGKRVLDTKRPLSLFGSLAIPSTKTYFRLMINAKNSLVLIPITGEDAGLRPCKVKGKTIIDAKTIQVNCTDGSNLLVEKGVYKRGDTILIDSKKQVKQRFPMEVGALVFLYKGTHVGMTATIKEIGQKEVLIEKDGKTFETRRAYCFVLGKGKPAFKIG